MRTSSLVKHRSRVCSQLAEPSAPSGKRNVESGKREAGSGKRKAESGKRTAGDGHIVGQQQAGQPRRAGTQRCGKHTSSVVKDRSRVCSRLAEISAPSESQVMDMQ